MPAPNAEVVAEVLTDWLAAEVRSSDQGRNAVLSDFDERKQELDLEFDDPANINSHKVISHHNRLGLWCDQYSKFGFSDDDTATARITFAGLIMISGDFRVECLLRANSGEEYRWLRHQNGPVSVNTEAIVADELQALGRPTEVNLASLMARTKALNDARLASRIQLNRLGRQPDEAIACLQAGQRDWIALSTAQIMVWAALRDDSLERVPFFEANSISDQTNLLYPFANYR